MEPLTVIILVIIAFALGYKFALYRYRVKQLLALITILIELYRGDITSAEASKLIDRLNT